VLDQEKKTYLLLAFTGHAFDLHDATLSEKPLLSIETLKERGHTVLALLCSSIRQGLLGKEGTVRRKEEDRY